MSLALSDKLSSPMGSVVPTKRSGTEPEPRAPQTEPNSDSGPFSKYPPHLAESRKGLECCDDEPRAEENGGHSIATRTIHLGGELVDNDLRRRRSKQLKKDLVVASSHFRVIFCLRSQHDSAIYMFRELYRACLFSWYESRALDVYKHWC